VNDIRIKLASAQLFMIPPLSTMPMFVLPEESKGNIGQCGKRTLKTIQDWHKLGVNAHNRITIKAEKAPGF